MVTKSLERIIAVVVGMIIFGVGQQAKAQYYEIANQLPGVISPALSGSMNYKGFIELSGVAGFGDNRANIIGVTTSQGFQYSSWFFMGAGLGVEVAMTNSDMLSSDVGQARYREHSNSSTKVMIPVFSDFRFNFGNTGGVSFFADVKLGAIWLIGNSYLRLQEGCMTGDAQFYCKPALGVRIPVSSTNQRQAVNIGVAYELITSDNNYNYWNDNNITLNCLGVSLSFEW
ncbi:MAG: hypothetical protein DBY35_01520 [Bacteroidales bacterium]|nr:MAG: hypothetical protein DBY35_01520 [Bacteroidales bacterium]